MNRINITVYYNTNRSGMITGYKQGDLLEKVWQGTVDSGNISSVLANVFNYLNGEDTPWSKPPASVSRSMSVGDVVVLERNGFEEVHACANSGWDQIYPKPQPTVYVTPELSDFSESQIQHIKDALQDRLSGSFENGFINAIRYVRSVGSEFHGRMYSLKDAKDFVEGIREDLK